MTAYTLTSDKNIDALSPARTGGDTVNTGGFTFTIDQDTRYGAGGGTGFSLGNLTVNPTLGGKILIDGRYVRLIPFTGGTGTVPAYNTLITQGAASGKLVAVMANLTSAPLAPGASMPASGFIKIKQWNGVAYTAGSMTGPPAAINRRQTYLTPNSRVQTNVVVVAGDTILVGFYQDGGLVTTNIADNAAGGSNVYEQIGEGVAVGGGVGCTLRVFRAIAKASETLTINETGGSGYTSMFVHVLIGTMTVENFAIKADPSGATAHTSASLTTTNPNAYLFCFWGEAGGGFSMTVNGSGFTKQRDDAGTATHDRIVSTAGSYQDIVTSTGSVLYASMLIALNPISGGGGAIGATASAADRAGWIEVVGDESAGIIANRLGTVDILGEWFELGTTSGVANQTFQIPTNGSIRYAAGVFIEKTPGQGDFEFYPNAGTATTIGTEEARGKVCWIPTTGLVRLGNNGSATMGYTPGAGRRVVIGNVFLENCTTAARATNAIPHATVASRYDFTTTGGGVVTIDKADIAWYLSFAQAYSVALSNLGTIDAILVSELASPANWLRVGVGNKPGTALLTNPLSMLMCFAGGTITECTWTRVSHSATGLHTLSFSDIAGFTFVRNVIRANTIRAHATTYAVSGLRMTDCTFTNPHVIQGPFALTTCTRVNVTNPIYVDGVSGTTPTTYTTYLYYLASSTVDCTLEGLTLPVTNNQPYGGLLYLAAAGCSKIRMRNIGTPSAPLSLGSTNGAAYIVLGASGASGSDIKVQRVYCANTRTGIHSLDNSFTRVLFDNVFGDYADAPVHAALNLTVRGMRGTPSLTAQTAVYGTHWFDCFTSATAGRIGLMMNEPTALTAAQVTLTGGAAFTSAGGLYMPTIGMSATFETPDYIIGHTAFANSVGVMGGGTIGNYEIYFAVDINDGNGFTPWGLASAANLAGITGIDATRGFKFRVRITTVATNTAAISSLYFTTVTSTTAQGYQYVLDSVDTTVTLTNIVVGSRYQIETLVGGLLFSGTATASTVVLPYTWTEDVTVRVRVRKASTQPKYQAYETLGVIDATGLAVYVSQLPDPVSA